MPVQLVHEKEAGSNHSDEHHRYDLVLVTFVILFSERHIIRIDRQYLHCAWETYLWLLERKGIRYHGFYRDIVNGRYRALDDVISQLLGLYVYYKLPEHGNFVYLSFVRKHFERIKANSNPSEWDAIRTSIPYLVRRLRKPRKSQWYM